MSIGKKSPATKILITHLSSSPPHLRIRRRRPMHTIVDCYVYVGCKLRISRVAMPRRSAEWRVYGEPEELMWAKFIITINRQTRNGNSVVRKSKGAGKGVLVQVPNSWRRQRCEYYCRGNIIYSNDQKVDRTRTFISARFHTHYIKQTSCFAYISSILH